MSPTERVPGFFRIRIASGALNGFYVGPQDSQSLAQPTSQAEQALSLKGFSYLLYTQEDAATCFGSSVALDVQADLRQLGVDSELI